MIAGGFLGRLVVDPVSPSVALLALLLGVAGGAAVGRLVWSWLSEQSRDRVERLAAELSREAREAVARGDVVQEEPSQRD
jgi:hypothetical protein